MSRRGRRRDNIRTKIDVEVLGDSPGDRVLDERVTNNNGDNVIATLAAELGTSNIGNIDDSGVDLVVVGNSNKDSLMASLGIHETKEGLLGNKGTSGGTSSISTLSN